jgi:branched-chain amino acid transport system substrate-binding protein
VRGAYFTTDFRPEISNEAATEFIADCAVEYDAAPESPAALAYDAVQMLASALERADSVDREAVREGMVRLPRYNGVTGTIQFLPGSGDPEKPANVMQIKDGKFVWVANVEP